MSRESDYRANAIKARALAETIGDSLSRKSLLQAADCWLLLADMEAAARPRTRWDHFPSSAPRGVYDHGDRSP